MIKLENKFALVNIWQNYDTHKLLLSPTEAKNTKSTQIELMLIGVQAKLCGDTGRNQNKPTHTRTHTQQKPHY